MSFWRRGSAPSALTRPAYTTTTSAGRNLAVDRERAEQVIARRPHTVFMARANRAFLGRVVRWSLERGVTQFLDLGSGVPTVGNVHEIAHEHDPAARVAYVDFETVAVAHATEIIKRSPASTTTTATRADARHPDTVLAAPGVAGLLDFDRPVALLAVSVFPFIDGDISTLVSAYRSRLSSGSVVALSHISDDQPDPAFAAQMRAMREAYLGSATRWSCATVPSCCNQRVRVVTTDGVARSEQHNDQAGSPCPGLAR